ncbi:DUF1127 domain-containing protein [Marinobacter caseinilyticus]|uniref:DUF1127 domain-containing protein n=1 Tax=Marinobacter caseinilyticus TaxID=2692195 RepID=UPI0014076723
MFKKIRAKQQLWNIRRSSRNQLSKMDRHLLRDIGVTPTDALNEIRKPFWRG